MSRVGVVSAYVPLNVKHLSPDTYRALGRRLKNACGGRDHFFEDFPLEDCWLSWENPPMIPAGETPADRYDTPEDHVRSHIVQHSRTQWAVRAAAENPELETIVWLDYGILKQGDWTRKPVQVDHIRDLLDKLEKYPLDHIPFPGIEEQKPVNPFGNNWRFCGSTHIWPVKFLPAIDRAYRFELRQFIRQYGKVPLDLAIWPAVEKNSGLPFRWYKAEYDATQLTNFGA